MKRTRYVMSRQVNTIVDPLLSREEVARQVGCSTRTVIRAEKRGDLAAMKMSSRMTRYRASAVQRWINRASGEVSDGTREFYV